MLSVASELPAGRSERSQDLVDFEIWLLIFPVSVETGELIEQTVGNTMATEAWRFFICGAWGDAH